MKDCVTLPLDQIKLIDQMVGEAGRDEFVTAAVAEAIRLRRVAAIEQFAGSLADVDIPGWETSESTAEWVRALRRGDPLPVPDGESTS
jgi:hypothetical protein